MVYLSEMDKVTPGAAVLEMRQTRKGNPWYFGMEAHMSVDAASGLVCPVAGTAANVPGGGLDQFASTASQSGLVPAASRLRTTSTQ